MLAAKCALAARVDFYKVARDGSQGKPMKSHIESRLEKALEHPLLNQRNLCQFLKKGLSSIEVAREFVQPRRSTR
jgi:RNA processing factor Prp31